MPTNDPLDALFECWREATPPFDTPLAPRVWQRIAHRERQCVPLGFWSRLEHALRRPALAASLIAACVLLGLFLAELRLSRLYAERSAELERSYLQLIIAAPEETSHVVPTALTP